MSPLRSNRSRAEELGRIELETRRAARRSLIPFCEATYPGFIAADHLQRLAAHLEALERGEITRLMITMPPRHGKSLVVSRRFPAWALGRDPHRQIISASYGAELSHDFGRDVRNLMQSWEYLKIFPGAALAADSQSVDRFNTAAGGSYVAAGVGTAITGRGANILNIDDPVKDRAQAESETYRKSIWEWYKSVAYTRLQPSAVEALTMTRWREDDLAGLLLAEAEQGTGDKWVQLDMPAINKDGEALWPRFFNRDALTAIHAVIGENDWQALYMQRPRPPGGSFFSVDDLLVNGQPVEPPQHYDAVYAVLDTALKTGKNADGLGVGFFLKSNALTPPLVLLDWELIQIEGAMIENWMPTVFSRLERYAAELHVRYGSAGAFIEDKASGIVLLQQAQKHADWQTRAIDSKLTALGKSERAINVSGYVHAGEVKLARAAYERTSMYKGRNRNHLLAQVLGFRAGTLDMGEDDLLDCFSYGIAIGLGNRGGF